MLFIILFLVVLRVKSECEGDFQCVNYKECKTNEDFFFPCGINGSICCAQTGIIKIAQKSAFPKVCGLYLNDDRVSGGQIASIAQFPWMALLGYTTLDFVEFLCGGTLITENYVLTAAHCTDIPTRILSIVRLGEHSLSTSIDCHNQICADPHLDVPIELVLPHEDYDKKSLKNDLALIKLKEKVVFTSFIAPICLPFGMDLKEDDWYKRSYIISGWGKTESDHLFGSDALQFARVKIWNYTSCKLKVPPQVDLQRRKQICANGPGKEDACKGDSGGPLFNITARNDMVIAVQYGIVSYKFALTCGILEIPTIFTRIDAYLEWIVKNVI